MWSWLKENVFVKDMFIYIFVSAVIFYIPAWGSALLGFLSGNGRYFVFSALYVGLWAGPFTPTVPLILGMAVFFKQLVKKIKE